MLILFSIADWMRQKTSNSEPVVRDADGNIRVPQKCRGVRENASQINSNIIVRVSDLLLGNSARLDPFPQLFGKRRFGSVESPMIKGMYGKYERMPFENMSRPASDKKPNSHLRPRVLDNRQKSAGYDGISEMTDICEQQLVRCAKPQLRELRFRANISAPKKTGCCGDQPPFDRSSDNLHESVFVDAAATTL